MIYEKEIFKSIMKMMHSKDIVILGIDGLGGAGKSTISEPVQYLFKIMRMKARERS